MNYSSTTAPAHFGDVKVAVLGPDNIDWRRDSPVQYRVSYINNLPSPVTVVWRSGFRFTLPPWPTLANNRLVARVEIDFAHSVKVNAAHVLSVVNESSTHELQVMREAFSSNIRSSAYGGMTLTLDYSLTLEQLRRYGGSVYFHELDCVLSLNSLEEAPPHPFSAEGSSMRLIETSPASSGCSFGYSVDVVDNMGRYGDRYINIGGKIYRIDAVKDPVRRDGIYVVSNAPVEGELGGIGPVVKHYPFEGADTQLGLFRTAEEATHLGDASQARKRELAELEHELSIGRKQLQAAKEAHELDMLGMTREMEQLKRKGERDAADLERLRALEELEQKRIKDYYDGKSYERKDNHEALKMIPAIIVGIGAILLALKGLMAPKK